MAHLKFSGEIVRQGSKFAVKVEIGQIPNQAEAQGIGEFLHDTLSQFFESRGAVLMHGASEPERKLILDAH